MSDNLQNNDREKGGAPARNQNGLKLKDPEVRQLAYDQYCAHLAKGKSKKSWYFEHPELRCTWETMEKYIKNEVEFDPLHKRIAEAKGFGHWEGIVEDSANGKNKGANTASLQMLMRNKYGWDKQADNETSISSEYFQAHEALMRQICNSQAAVSAKSNPEFESKIRRPIGES